MRRRTQHTAALVDTTTVKVRFSEVDSMHVVWHGEYVRYFEDGRESFGRHYGISYLDVAAQGYQIPVVELDCQFKQSLRYGDTAIVETRFIPCEAAKILFEYVIYRESDHTVVATGSTVQVFLNRASLLELNNPEFYLIWKKKWNMQ